MEQPRARPVRIELTEEQRRRIREQTGEDATVLEFTAEELEDRIAPSRGDILPIENVTLN